MTQLNMQPIFPGSKSHASKMGILRVKRDSPFLLLKNVKNNSYHACVWCVWPILKKTVTLMRKMWVR